MRILIAAASAVFAVASLTATANAAPALGGGIKSVLEQETKLVEKTHGIHRYCARGPAGWHRHKRGYRIPCPPPRVYRRGY